MPEGDTVHRTAATLQRWIGGRTVTAATSQRERVPPAALVGQTIRAVEADGKHLLIRFESGRTLHTHFRMTGAWHVYRAGERWKRPAHLARVVLECGDRVAVCFDAPVVELLDGRTEREHPALTRLGPDVMGDEFDLAEARRRARRARDHEPIGVVLLDQSVVAGIGNIYRCEALFVAGVDPRRAIGTVDDETLERVLGAAHELMRAHRAIRRQPWVYGRAGRPCRRCGTAITTAPLGDPPRTAYWCPTCQPWPDRTSHPSSFPE